MREWQTQSGLPLKRFFNTSGQLYKSLELKDRLFCEHLSNGNDYINLAALINRKNTGILQKILPVEQQVLKRGHIAVEQLRKEKKAERDMEKYYDWVDDYLLKIYGTF